LKRGELIKKIEAQGGVLIRHGGKHAWYQNPVTKAARGIAIREGLLKGGEPDYFPSVRLSRLMDELNLPLAA
jgi:hypothetical protein